MSYILRFYAVLADTIHLKLKTNNFILLILSSFVRGKACFEGLLDGTSMLLSISDCEMLLILIEGFIRQDYSLYALAPKV